MFPLFHSSGFTAPVSAPARKQPFRGASTRFRGHSEGRNRGKPCKMRVLWGVSPFILEVAEPRPRIAELGPHLHCLCTLHAGHHTKPADERQRKNEITVRTKSIMGIKRWVTMLGKDRKSTRLNSSHPTTSRMPSSA